MGSTAVPLGSFAALVLPLLALEEREIDAPDEDRSAPFHSPRRIDRVAPHDVPTRVIVVRLNWPKDAHCPSTPKLPVVAGRVYPSGKDRGSAAAQRRGVCASYMD